MSTRSFSEILSAAAVAALAAAVAGGCQRRSDPPEVQAAWAAVMRYDDRLPAAFRTGDVAALGGCATEAESDRVGAIIAGLASRGQVMLARLSDLRMDRASVRSPEQVVVETTETWLYEHRSAGAPARAVAQQQRTYRMSYQVGLHGGVWQVEHAAVNGETAQPLSSAR